MRRPARRKRASRRRPIEKEPVEDPNMPYQCTFCTEVFKTKYDWQRHEKSLHLPLEQWVCTLHGPRAPKKEVKEPCCVFCGEEAADDAHIETHHFSACQERSLEERTFHRKDHLVQHLRLVHNTKYAEWSMKQWMLPMPSINSRCGFCGLTMSTWVERTDHLADHFKIGATMADWQGDWGFDEAIVNMVESAMPPCKFAVGCYLFDIIPNHSRFYQLRAQHTNPNERQRPTLGLSHQRVRATQDGTGILCATLL